MTARRHVPDAERRARLVARHHLRRTASDVLHAVRDVVAAHSSDPLTPYLGAWARVPGLATADVDRALYDDRVLWRLHAMRRTLFVVPTSDAPLLGAAAGLDVAASQRRRLERWLADEMPATEVPAWLADVEERVATTLAGGGEWRTAELTAAVPALQTEITVGSGRWRTRTPVSSRVLTVLALEGRIVRTRPAGSWRSSQYRWADATDWFGSATARGVGTDAADARAADARAELARRYLARYGPATRDDLRWWTGWTVRRTDRALAGIGAVTVTLDGGGEGYVEPHDLEPTDVGPGVGADTAADDGGPSVALLPGLDATTMGWKDRDWYLAGHGEALFDRNGNAGPTVWVDGRVVGAWAQRPDGEVVVRLLEDVGSDATARVAREAARLTAWLDGEVATPRFRSPLERELSS